MGSPKNQKMTRKHACRLRTESVTVLFQFETQCTGSFNYGRLLVLCPLLATSSAKNCTKMQLSSSSAGQTSAPNLVPKPLKNVQKLKETPLPWKNMPTTNLGKSCGFAIQNAINLPYKLCHESLVPFSHYLSLFYHI